LLNAQRRVEGFYLWVVANIAFAAKAASIGDWSMVVLWCVYTLITLNGIRVWWKKEREERDTDTLDDIGSEIAEANRRALYIVSRMEERTDD
jgi:nicotinamide riboside transporter PnuC